MGRSIEDSRSRKIVFVSHCVLNQNAKVRGIATFPGVIQPLLEVIVRSGAGIYQMPCPEMLYMGAMRWGHVKDQYDSPMFRRHCRSIADTVLDAAEDYRRSGYRICGFVMIDGSPVCGLKKVPQPRQDGQMWGGMVWQLPEQQIVQGVGVFCNQLLIGVGDRGMNEIPFHSIPEGAEAGSLDSAIAEISALL